MINDHKPYEKSRDSEHDETASATEVDTQLVRRRALDHLCRRAAHDLSQIPGLWQSPHWRTWYTQLMQAVAKQDGLSGASKAS